MELSGYRYDEATKKYYKLLPFEISANRANKFPNRLDNSFQRSKKAKQISSRPAQGTPAKLASQHPFNDFFEKRWNAASERRVDYKHDIEGLAMSKYKTTKRLFPDCLPIEESITAIAFDEDPIRGATVRVGGSSGSIASGYLNGNSFDYPNDEHLFRLGWFLTSSVTSLLTTPRGRMVATCLGLPAQALIGTTNETISSGSVTFSPRKTSIWTSAINEEIVALGCDRKVLLSSDPSRASLLSYTTGSWHGDGAVYALDLTDNLVFAGTRNGNVKIFDRRSSGSSSDGGDHETKAEINIMIQTPVTHLRRIDSGLVVTGLDGTLDVYDLRFTPRPSVRLLNHSNSYTRDLGFDIWKDDFLVAAGQDCKVRLWSLRKGVQLHPSADSVSISTRVFREPIKAIKFRESAGDRNDQGGRTSDGIARSSELWFANGSELECCGIDPHS